MSRGEYYGLGISHGVTTLRSNTCRECGGPLHEARRRRCVYCEDGVLADVPECLQVEAAIACMGTDFEDAEELLVIREVREVVQTPQLLSSNEAFVLKMLFWDDLTQTEVGRRTGRSNTRIGVLEGQSFRVLRQGRHKGEGVQRGERLEDLWSPPGRPDPLYEQRNQRPCFGQDWDQEASEAWIQAEEAAVKKRDVLRENGVRANAAKRARREEKARRVEAAVKKRNILRESRARANAAMRARQEQEDARRAEARALVTEPTTIDFDVLAALLTGES